MERVTIEPWAWSALIAIGLSVLWGALVQVCGTRKHERHLRGFVLGALEATIFMVTFAGFAVVGASWLAFKVASKWKSWSLMADAMREAKNPVTAKEVDTQYHRFLIGTAGNVVVGLIAAAIAISLGGHVFS